MKRYVLPKRTLLLWQIRVVMSTTFLILFCLLYIKAFLVLKIAIWILITLGLAIVALYLPLFFKRYEILFQGEAIIVNYGVFIKFSHVMPYPRLIYAQTFATPLARIMGVTALSLKAARSRVIIPEVLLPEALRVLDSLTDEVQNDKNI